jgi:hypothetical protein
MNEKVGETPCNTKAKNKLAYPKSARQDFISQIGTPVNDRNLVGWQLKEATLANAQPERLASTIDPKLY